MADRGRVRVAAGGRVRGLEPPRALAHMRLRHACIPISPQPRGRSILANSALDPHVLDERCNDLAPVDPDVPGTVLAIHDPRAIEPIESAHLVARFAEQVEDV